MVKEKLLIENQRMIAKAESKIVLKENVDYWERELNILMDERVMIEDGTWQ